MLRDVDTSVVHGLLSIFIIFYPDVWRIKVNLLSQMNFTLPPLGVSDLKRLLWVLVNQDLGLLFIIFELFSHFEVILERAVSVNLRVRLVFRLIHCQNDCLFGVVLFLLI